MLKYHNKLNFEHTNGMNGKSKPKVPALTDGAANGGVIGNGVDTVKTDGDDKGPALLGGGYAQGKQALMALINELRSDGASLEVDLPTIVVAGNQSAGKSSLIEAISGINLPRAAGTCTREPTEVRLRQEDREWRCSVKIRWESNMHGEDKNEKPEIDFGAPIFDPAQVETVIRRAQLAILNPSIEPYHFVGYALPEVEEKNPLGSVKQLAFSRSVIVLDISGPHVTDLTIIDLPGIVQNVDKAEDPNNITLVQDLVKSYIAKDCLILLVITMKGDDIQNQAAARLASEADPDGKRTIGVLTKVDTLRGRDVDNWVKVLRGEKEPLIHGYYVTRQPDADELAEGISFDQAREKEQSFFDNTAPWNTLSNESKMRLGTRNLAASLSDQLLAFIREKLPTLIAQINDRYEHLTLEYTKLGKEPSHDPANEMLGLVTDFTAAIHDNVQGNPGMEQFMQNINAEYVKYRDNVWATAPRFAPVQATDKLDLDVNGKPIKKNKDLGIVDIDDLKEGNQVHAGQAKTVMNLDDVRLHVQRALTRESPNNVPFPAKVQLIRNFTATWRVLAADLLAQVVPIVSNPLAQSAKDVFASYADGRLVGRVQETINERIEVLVRNTDVQLAKMVAFDDRPFTQNTNYLNDMRAKILAGLRELRNPGQETVSAAMAALAKLGVHGIEPEDLAKLRPTDEFEEELTVMAETRAFWHLAYKRTIDYIPQTIDAEFIIPIALDVRTALIDSLAIFDREHPERCREMLAEGPFKQKKREDLKQRRQRLERAKGAIRNFAVRG